MRRRSSCAQLGRSRSTRARCKQRMRGSRPSGAQSCGQSNCCTSLAQQHPKTSSPRMQSAGNSARSSKNPNVEAATITTALSKKSPQQRQAQRATHSTRRTRTSSWAVTAQNVRHNTGQAGRASNTRQTWHTGQNAQWTHRTQMRQITRWALKMRTTHGALITQMARRPLHMESNGNTWNGMETGRNT